MRHTDATSAATSQANPKTFLDRDNWMRAVLAADLPYAAKCLALAIAMHVHVDSGRCNPSFKTLATASGMGERSAYRWIELLEQEGWITVERSTGRHANRYTLSNTANSMAVFNPANTATPMAVFNPANTATATAVFDDAHRVPNTAKMTAQHCHLLADQNSGTAKKKGSKTLSPDRFVEGKNGSGSRRKPHAELYAHFTEDEALKHLKNKAHTRRVLRAQGLPPTEQLKVDSGDWVEPELPDAIKARLAKAWLKLSSEEQELLSSWRQKHRIELDAEDPFEQFWRAYPKRVDKLDAEKAFARAIEREDPATIIAGAKRYASERADQDPKYTKHPARWLRAGGWMNAGNDADGVTIDNVTGDIIEPRPRRKRRDEDMTSDELAADILAEYEGRHVH